MVHDSNPTHLPPVKSPREYEEKIAKLEKRVASLELMLKQWYREHKAAK